MLHTGNDYKGESVGRATGSSGGARGKPLSLKAGRESIRRPDSVYSQVVIVHLSLVQNGRLSYCLEHCWCKDSYWDKERIAPDFPVRP